MNKRLIGILKSWRNKTVSPLHKWNNLQIAIDFVIANNIIGDYLEFGVYKGDSFIYSYNLYKNRFKRYKKFQQNKGRSNFLNQKVRFFAFDSFEGLPENDNKDIPLHWIESNAMSYPRYKFEKNLKSKKVDSRNVVITEGYYDKSLTPSHYEEIGLKKAALIHIDCDLFESTKTVLNTIKPLLVEGTIIIFDDYFYYKGSPYKGERGAFNEWLYQNKDIVASELCKFPPAASFILNKRDKKNHTILSNNADTTLFTNLTS